MPLLDPSEIMFTAFTPMVANRFILYIDGIPSYLIKKVTSPHFVDAEIKIDHINTYFFVAGKREWQDMTLELFSSIVPSGAQSVMEWARMSYESVTGRAGYPDFYKKDLTLDVIGPVGDIIGEWIIKGAWVKDAAFGEFDWSVGDQALMIPMTIKMDYCVLNF